MPRLARLIPFLCVGVLPGMVVQSHPGRLADDGCHCDTATPAATANAIPKPTAT